MSITVIIVNFNSGGLLCRCLDHLRRQSVPPQRICIVDNASTDGSACIADLSENEILIPMPVNAGFAAGNNRALRECTTEYVALLNPDAFPEPDWLENLLIAAQTHPDVAAFGSRQVCDENPNMLDGIG
ncbi:glycosyltransferase, partial [Desulfosarcina sp. OttesenSCG-928-B08]|nr:glycosyltransferase [Desulfosarcina sp. OttesenSCG-928-B08]